MAKAILKCVSCSSWYIYNDDIENYHYCSEECMCNEECDYIDRIAETTNSYEWDYFVDINNEALPF